MECIVFGMVLFAKMIVRCPPKSANGQDGFQKTWKISEGSDFGAWVRWLTRVTAIRFNCGTWKPQMATVLYSTRTVVSAPHGIATKIAKETAPKTGALVGRRCRGGRRNGYSA